MSNELPRPNPGFGFVSYILATQALKVKLISYVAVNHSSLAGLNKRLIWLESRQSNEWGKGQRIGIKGDCGSILFSSEIIGRATLEYVIDRTSRQWRHSG